MNDITLRYAFTAAGTSPYSRSLGASLLVQTDGVSCEVFGSNLPDDGASWQSLGTAAGYVPVSLSTSFAFLRVVSAGAGTVAISAADSSSAGGGGAGGGLTNAELRASAVPVIDAAAAVSPWQLMETAAVDEAVAGTTYVLQYPAEAGRGLAWGIKRIVVASGVTTITYAGPSNNSGQASASAAWAARASLVYGLPKEA